MEVTISGDAEEIAALVLEIQERREPANKQSKGLDEITIPNLRCETAKELADEMMKRYGCKVTFGD